MSLPIVIVTGANGALGRSLMARLGGRARLWAGVWPPSSDVAGAERTFAADLSRPDVSIPLESGATVYHLAAFVHRRARSTAEREEMRRLNENATARIAGACRETGAKLVFASTVAVFGPHMGRVRDDAAPAPHTDYALTKLAAENAIRSEGDRGLKHAIVRFPLLYGPGGRGNMERMLRAIAARTYLPVGDPRTPKSCLYIDDAAAALVRAGAITEERDRTFTAAPRHTPTLGRIHAAAFGAVGRVGLPHVPTALALALARIGDTGLRLAGRLPLLAQAVETLTSPTDYDGSRFHAATGFDEEVSVEEGMRRTVEWMRAARSPA